MNLWKRIAIGIALTGSLAAEAAESELPVEIFNRVRVEYDDNINTTTDEAGKNESFKLIEELELLIDAELENTYFGLRYMPAFILYEDRPGDDTDLDHQLDVILNQSLTPRTSIRFKDTFRVSEDPALVEGDVTVRNNNDFMYNSVNAALDTQVIPEKTTLRVDGRYAFIDYDEEQSAEANNYDNASAGIDLIQQLTPSSTMSLETRVSTFDYDDDLRDSDAVQLGLGGSMVFSPKVQGDMRVGYQTRESDNALEADSDSGYLSGNMVFLPAEKSRISIGAAISEDKSPTSQFVSQDRLRLFGSYVQGLTARLSLTLSGAWSEGKFDAADATSEEAAENDGDETSVRLSTTLSYKIGTQNWLELSYQYVELDSEVRVGENYDRNRASLGWKIQL